MKIEVTVMKKILLILLVLSAVMSMPVIMISCSGGSSSSGSSSDGNTSSGSVALYVTDSPDKDYKQVELTINGVQLVHTGSGTTCDVLTSPVTIDLTDIASVLKLLDVTNCPARSYNRIHIELDKQGNLIDLNDISDTCTLTSYKDNNDNPNVLYCNGDVCSLDINGAVNVLANKGNGLALDFDLKDFEVNNFNSLSLECTVTMKVSPLNASDLDEYDEEISGVISNLDAGSKTFTLTTESGAFTVSYTGVIISGIDDLLTLAQTDQLEVEVKSSSIDLTAMTIDASVIYVVMEGAVSSLDTNTHTFTLTYGIGSTITVDYTNAEVEGVLTDDVTVEVELEGYNSVNYIAHEVEVE